MDFNSLGQGSPFYILRKVKGEKPVLEVGVVRGKTNPTANYNAQGIPGAYNGMYFPFVTTVTISINGVDKVIPDLPINVEVAMRGNETYSCTREGIMQAVDNMVQNSKMNIANHPYDEMCIAEGEKMMETLNPNFAEEKRRATSIQELQSKSAEQDKRLAAIEDKSSEMLSILRQLTGGPSPSKSQKS